MEAGGFLKTTNDGNFSQTDYVQASASLNTWTHFAVKLQNGTVTLIRDGVVVASKAATMEMLNGVDLMIH